MIDVKRLKLLDVPSVSLSSPMALVLRRGAELSPAAQLLCETVMDWNY